MSRSLGATLCVLLSICCGSLGWAASPKAHTPSLLINNPTAWDFLDGAHDWQAQVERRARGLRLKVNSSEPLEPECLWCRQEMKCQLKTLSAVAGFLAGQKHGQGRLLWQKLQPTFASGFKHIVQHLSRGNSFAALRQSVALADKLGWAWQGTHLTAWGHGYAQCWDQIALLRVMMHHNIEGSLAMTLNFGSLDEEWQGYLNDFFSHSKEHALPWTVEGNLEPLTTLHTVANATLLSNTVQWALPRLWFEISEYLANPDEPMWQHAEARAFIAAGYAWYPTLRAQHKDARFGVRLWVPPKSSHTPTSKGECMEWVDEPLHFNVTVTVVHAWNPAANWTANWICSWPSSFDNLLTCAAPSTMPLWRMLTEDLPGFVHDEELLLTVTVQLLPPDCGGMRAADGASTAMPDVWEKGQKGGEGGEVRPDGRQQEEVAACLARAAASVGPLSHVGDMLATPILRWGFLGGDPGLRGLHGFESRRLPGSGALGVGRHLATVAAQRMASTPWVDAALYSDPRAEAAMAEAEAAHGSGAGGDSMCGAQGLASEGEEAFCGAEGIEIIWDDGSPEPGSHLTNALAALALVTVPLAAWQAVRAYNRRQERLRAARQTQRAKRYKSNMQPHRPRAANGARCATKPSRAIHEQAASTATTLPAASKHGHAKADQPSPTIEATDIAGGSGGEATVSASVAEAKPQRRQAKASTLPVPASPSPAPTAIELEAWESSLEAAPPPDVAGESATHPAPVSVSDETAANPGMPAAPAPAPAASYSTVQATSSSTADGAAGSDTAPASREPSVPAVPWPADLLPSASDVLAAMLPFELAGVLPSSMSLQQHDQQQQREQQQQGQKQQQQQQPQASLAAAAAAPPPATEALWEEQTAPIPQLPAIHESGAAGDSLAGSGSAPGTPAAAKTRYAAVTPAPPTLGPGPRHRPYSPLTQTAAAAKAAAAEPVTVAAAAEPVTVAAAAPTPAGDGEPSECIVCWEAERAVVLVPCGHLGLCRSCADDLLEGSEPLCPLCRASVLFAQAFYSA